jgi:hypothetical protein
LRVRDFGEDLAKTRIALLSERQMTVERKTEEQKHESGEPEVRFRRPVFDYVSIVRFFE